MTVMVYANSTYPQRFDDVEGISVYTGRDNNTGKAVAQWTKYGEDAWPSTEWVNLDPAMLQIRSIDVDSNGLLCAYVYSIR